MLSSIAQATYTPQIHFGAKRQDSPAFLTPLHTTRQPQHLEDFANRKPGADRNGILYMDIKNLSDRNDWFRIDADYAAMIARKKEFMAHRKSRKIVSATRPEGRAGARELLEMMAEHLPEAYPQHFEKQGRILTNKITGDVFDLDNLPDTPINIAAQLVQEDLVLIHPDGRGNYRVASGALCFPSGWSLQEKLGKTIKETHKPVPGVNTNIGDMINTFLQRLSPKRQSWRINFLTFSTPELSVMPDMDALYPDYNYPESGFDKITKETVGQLFLRSEREVFTKLPKSGDVLFSLKTYITPFSELPPETAAQLVELYSNLPDKFVALYKGWTRQEQQIVVNYLRQRAGIEAPDGEGLSASA